MPKRPTTSPPAAPGGIEAGRTDAKTVREWTVDDSPFADGPEVDRKRRTLRLNALVDPDEQRADDLVQHAKIRWSSALDPGFAESVGLPHANGAAGVRARAELRQRDLLTINDELLPDQLNAIMASAKPEQLPALLCELGPGARKAVLGRLSSDLKRAHVAFSEAPANRGLAQRWAQLRAAYTATNNVQNQANYVEAYTQYSLERGHTALERRGYRRSADDAERSLANVLRDVRQTMKDSYDQAMVGADALAKATKRAEESKARIERAPAPPKGTEAHEARLKALAALEKLGKLRFPDREGTAFSPLVWGKEEWTYNMKPPMRITRRTRRSDTGPRILRPFKLETDPEARGFGRRLPSLGVMIVVDASGSMGLSHHELREAMLAAPSSVVMCYSGPHVDGRGEPQVNAYKLAEGDRVRPEMPRMCGSNSCDLPALEWAWDNRRGRPVIWVSDNGFTGSRVDSKGHLQDTDCTSIHLERQMEAFMVGNADQVARVGGVEELLNLLANWRVGNVYLPEDECYGLNRRAVGSHI